MDKNKEEEAAIQRAEQAFSERRGYYSLEMTASIVAESKNVPLRSGQPSYLIWAKAVSARRQAWRVSGGLTHPKDDFAIPVRQVHREEGSFVYLSDFVEWSIEAGCMVEPSAIEIARRECEVSDGFERRVRVWEIDRVLAELLASKTEKTEAILARDAHVTELNRERSQIIASLRSDHLAPERIDTPAANTGEDVGYADGSAGEGTNGPNAHSRKRTKEELSWPHAERDHINMGPDEATPTMMVGVEEDAKTPQQQGAHMTNEPYRNSQRYCVEQAKQMWEQDEQQDDDNRFYKKEMLCTLQKLLAGQGMTQPNDDVLWGWLTKADIVPEYVRAPGRRPNYLKQSRP